MLCIGATHILIDAGPDLRQQMLRAGVKHLDAILLTHEHTDHVIGLDDIRPFNFRSGHPLAVYALPRVAADVRLRFAYVFGEPLPGLPRIELHHLDADTPFHLDSVQVEPIGVLHGRLPILGFRFGSLAYLTDVKSIEPDQLAKIAGVRFLVLNALQHKLHPTHLSLQEALALIEQINPEKAWITHISHHLGLAREVEKLLPPHVELGFDGAVIEIRNP
ncbi:MAG: MBL fold metallo-hydrolase [Saprospiraceae bacterium]